MERSIVDIIKFYNTFNKPIDEDFVQSISRILIKKYKLEKYVKDINVTKIPNTGIYYDNNLKKIVVNINELKYIVSKKIKNYKENSLLKYVFAVESIIHQLEYAYQIKFKDENDFIGKELLEDTENFIEDILNLLFENGLKKSASILHETGHNYKKNFKLSPNERIADINTFSLLIRELQDLNDQEVDTILNNEYYLAILRGYEISEEPSKYYYDSIGVKKDWSEVDEFSKKINDFEKAKLGLKTEEYVIDNLKSKIKK